MIRQSRHRRRNPLLLLPILPGECGGSEAVKDGSIHFEGRTYIVPFTYVGCEVEVRGCSTCVQVLDPKTATVLVSYPRHTPEQILIDPCCYDGTGTERVAPPKPLGKMAKKLAEIAAMPVQRRPVDLYAALAEVAR